MIRNFRDIEALAREKTIDPLLVAFVEPHEPKLIQAIDRAMKTRLVKPVLIGDEAAIYKAGKEVEIEVRGRDGFSRYRRCPVARQRVCLLAETPVQ